jgi:hypothetical protein
VTREIKPSQIAAARLLMKLAARRQSDVAPWIENLANATPTVDAARQTGETEVASESRAQGRPLRLVADLEENFEPGPLSLPDTVQIGGIVDTA